jgi:DNA polymerase III epsilon subunit family exonuclease
MQIRNNLISDSTIVQETINLLRECGGTAAAADIVDIVFKVSNIGPELASKIVTDLVNDDHRLRIREDSTIELIDEDVELRLLKASDFVVVDVETTGAKTPPCRVMEIGAYKVSGGRIVDEFESLVNPESSIPAFISQLTGIHSSMVQKSPVFSDIIEKWLDFAGDAILVAHNAQFDVRFLNYEVSRVYPGKQMANSSLCTVSLSRRMVPGLQNYRLHTVADHFNIPIENRHRASGDAQATAGILIRILERLHRHGVTNLAGARRCSILD